MDLARSGCRSGFPGAAPSYTARHESDHARVSVARTMRSDPWPLKGKPSFAIRTAPSANEGNERVPNRSRRANHASTAPGTVTVRGPRVGIWADRAEALTASRAAPAGARPEPL